MAKHPKDMPDAFLVREGGSGRVWGCLVVAKIGRNELEVEQVERYLAIALAVRLDAVLTISNQFVALPSHSPLSLPKSATKGVELYHWSWMSLLTQAQLLLRSEEHTSELQSLLRISYAVFCLKKTKTIHNRSLSVKCTYYLNRMKSVQHRIS